MQNKIFNWVLVISVCLTCVTWSSCKKFTFKLKEEERIQLPFSYAEKFKVTTYEIVNIIVRDNLKNKYSGEFSNHSIELHKINDSTLYFIVPEVENGVKELKFELAKIEFNVIQQTTVTDPEKVVSDAIKEVDLLIDELNNNSEEEAFGDSILAMRNLLVSYWSSMSAEQKKTAIGINQQYSRYIKNLNKRLDIVLDGSTVIRRGSQSSCPTTYYKDFYDCTADNMSELGDSIMVSAKECSWLLITAGVIAIKGGTLAALGPVGLGLVLGVVGQEVAVAATIFVFKLLPAVRKYILALKSLIVQAFVMDTGLFDNLTTFYTDEVSISLNLKPKFRSLLPSDNDISSSISRLITNISNLKSSLDFFKNILQPIPDYINNKVDAILDKADITISNINNSFVKYVSHDESNIKFRILSGKEENFTYKMVVKKEGFTREKVVSAKISPIPDSTTYYRKMLVGRWNVQNGENGGVYDMELFYGDTVMLLDGKMVASGRGVYYGLNGTDYTNGGYGMRWWVQRSGNRYYYWETGWFHPGFNQFRVTGTSSPYENIISGTTMFQTYSDFKDGKGPVPSLKYTKK